MGIFRSFTKLLKKAAPVIGGTIGFAIGGPLGSAAIGSALGAGIGSLVGGADTDDALKAALLGGIGGYAASGGNFFTPSTAAKANLATQAASPATYGFEAASSVPVQAVSTTPMTSSGVMSTLKDFAKSPVGIATLGSAGLAALSGGLEEEGRTKDPIKEPPFPKGRTRLGMGLVDGISFNLDDPDERQEYFKRVREKQGFEEEFELAGGGEVEGPGTGTSDSVPARLSDGEFVLTAKAVRGAGGGDRDLGAARMYDMMSELERVA
tara:strand:+ start:268 stop:1065 length:798 start_codon:yes stop_codon:yes gene_type:complete